MGKHKKHDRKQGAKLSANEAQRVKRLYHRTMRYIRSDPETALIMSRKSIEAMCRQIYRHKFSGISKKPVEKLTLDEILSRITNEGVIPRRIIIALRTVQNYGNFGSHEQDVCSDRIDNEFVKPCLYSLAMAVNWYFGEYFEQEIDIHTPPEIPERDRDVNSQTQNHQNKISHTDINVPKQPDDILPEEVEDIQPPENLKPNEKKYFVVSEISYEDGIITFNERCFLNKKAQEYTISANRALEIEEMAKKYIKRRFPDIKDFQEQFFCGGSQFADPPIRKRTGANVVLLLFLLFLIGVASFSYLSYRNINDEMLDADVTSFSKALYDNYLDSDSWERFIEARSKGFLSGVSHIFNLTGTESLRKLPGNLIIFLKYPETTIIKIANKYVSMQSYTNAARYYDLIPLYNSIEERRQMQWLKTQTWAPNRAICYYYMGSPHYASAILDAFETDQLDAHQTYIKRISKEKTDQSIKATFAAIKKAYKEENWEECISAAENLKATEPDDRISDNKYIVAAYLYRAKAVYQLSGKQKQPQDIQDILMESGEDIKKARNVASSIREICPDINYEEMLRKVVNTKNQIIVHVFKDCIEKDGKDGFTLFREICSTPDIYLCQGGLAGNILKYIDWASELEEENIQFRTEAKNMLSAITTEAD